MPKFLLWKLILLKLSDVNKQFLWENSAKNNRWIAPSGPEWFRGGRWHSPGNHGWWCVDPNFKILLQIVFVGLACGMRPFMWRTAIPVKNVLKTGRTSFQMDVWNLSVPMCPGIPFWIFTSLIMNSEPFTLLFSSYLSVFLVTTKSDKRHVIIFIFLYIGDVIYHYIYKLLSSIIWIAISIHSNI